MHIRSMLTGSSLVTCILLAGCGGGGGGSSGSPPRDTSGQPDNLLPVTGLPAINGSALFALVADDLFAITLADGSETLLVENTRAAGPIHRPDSFTEESDGDKAVKFQSPGGYWFERNNSLYRYDLDTANVTQVGAAGLVTGICSDYRTSIENRLIYALEADRCVTRYSLALNGDANTAPVPESAAGNDTAYYAVDAWNAAGTPVAILADDARGREIRFGNGQTLPIDVQGLQALRLLAAHHDGSHFQTLAVMTPDGHAPGLYLLTLDGSSGSRIDQQLLHEGSENLYSSIRVAFDGAHVVYDLEDSGSSGIFYVNLASRSAPVALTSASSGLQVRMVPSTRSIAVLEGDRVKIHRYTQAGGVATTPLMNVMTTGGTLSALGERVRVDGVRDWQEINTRHQTVNSLENGFLLGDIVSDSTLSRSSVNSGYLATPTLRYSILAARPNGDESAATSLADTELWRLDASTGNRLSLGAAPQPVLPEATTTLDGRYLIAQGPLRDNEGYGLLIVDAEAGDLKALTFPAAPVLLTSPLSP